MVAPMIRALAVSLSGSEHIVIGGVRDKQSYQWQTEEEARAHLERIQWTNIRFQVDEKITGDGKVIIVWDNQSKTEHVPGSGTFTYLKGGPSGGAKISKSAIAQQELDTSQASERLQKVIAIQRGG
jgi:hypothetical protein